MDVTTSIKFTKSVKRKLKFSFFGICTDLISDAHFHAGPQGGVILPGGGPKLGWIVGTQQDQYKPSLENKF